MRSFTDYLIETEPEEVIRLAENAAMAGGIEAAAQQALQRIMGQMNRVYGQIKHTFQTVGAPHGISAQNMMDKANVAQGGTMPGDIESGEEARQAFGGLSAAQGQARDQAKARTANYRQRMADPAYAYLNQMSGQEGGKQYVHSSPEMGRPVGGGRKGFWNRLGNFFAHFDNYEGQQLCEFFDLFEQNPVDAMRAAAAPASGDVASAMQGADITSSAPKLKQVFQDLLTMIQKEMMAIVRMTQSSQQQMRPTG